MVHTLESVYFGLCEFHGKTKAFFAVTNVMWVWCWFCSEKRIKPNALVFALTVRADLWTGVLSTEVFTTALIMNIGCLDRYTTNEGHKLCYIVSKGMGLLNLWNKREVTVERIVWLGTCLLCYKYWRCHVHRSVERLDKLRLFAIVCVRLTFGRRVEFICEWREFFRNQKPREVWIYTKNN